MRTFKAGGLLWVGLVLCLGSAQLAAQSSKTFRIGTGTSAGTYHPIGEIIAKAISDMPGLSLSTVPSSGSVANVEAISTGQIESGLTQADVAYWALTGTGAFEGKPQATELRAIANLYQESIHLVVRKPAGIQTVADLRGKRVSLDERGSGTLAGAQIILAGWGLKESDISVEHLKLQDAAQRLKDGTLDALFYIGGFPAPAITELANAGAQVELAPIDGPNAEKLRGDYKFFARDEIPTNTYPGIDGTRTLSVGAQWVTSAKVDANAVYEVTKRFWSDKTRQALEAGHPKGKVISKDNALHGVGIPLHPGAERFYKEAGLIN